MSTLRSLARRELLVVTGKGGVGKSAVAAALGSLLAAQGRKVLVLEIDPRENVHRMLGAPPSGGEILQVGPGFWLQNLRSRQVIDQLVREKVRLEFLIKRILGSPVYHHFAEGAPGLKEMAVLGHALLVAQGRAAGAPRVDTVVLDAPATGHGVSLLAAPLLVSEVIERGPVAALAREVAELVASARRCGVVVVTMAEEMPVTEALELRHSLRQRFGRRPDLLVVNGLYPPLTKATRAAGADAAGALWRERRELNEHELSRLQSEWPEPRLEVPLFPLETGPDLVQALAGSLSES